MTHFSTVKKKLLFKIDESNRPKTCKYVNTNKIKCKQTQQNNMFKRFSLPSSVNIRIN